MVAGAALVSAPIIIHLINRMRFRRVRWAAMEFLLKAQKRMRRKLIIEQLILLFLRCLLVFLLGLLVRPVPRLRPADGQGDPTTVHVVILDDTPSMADTGRAEGVDTDAFTEARRQITDSIMPAALEATTPQSLRILRLSDQGDVLNADPDPRRTRGRGRSTPNSIEHVRGQLRAAEALDRPREPRRGAEEGEGDARQDRRRRRHGEGHSRRHRPPRARTGSEDGEALDEGHPRTQRGRDQGPLHRRRRCPARPTDKSKPLAFSDNVGIVEFQPRTRVAAEDEPVDFEVRLKNYGTTDLKDVQVYFYLNGTGHIIQTLPFPHLPAGQERRAVAQVTFQREDEPKDRTLTKDNSTS